MKHFSAIIIAIIITAVIGLGIGVIGVNAITNTNTVPIQDTRTAPATASTLNGAPGSSDVQQLQQQVNTLQAQLDQAGQVVQQYQSILVQLDQRGIIRIDQNGNISLPQRNPFDDND